MTPKHPTSFRVSAEVKRLLQQLADKLSISQVSVIEIAVRELAKREQVTNGERR